MTILRLIFAVIFGVLVGGLVNMGIITLSPHLIPPPAGADMTTTAGVQAAMAQIKPIHLLMPFLAHAIGTLAGAALAAWLTAKYKLQAALAVSVVFLIGGIMAASMIPAPAWFIACDLILAYIPAAWLGYHLVSRRH